MNSPSIIAITNSPFPSEPERSWLCVVTRGPARSVSGGWPSCCSRSPWVARARLCQAKAAAFGRVYRTRHGQTIHTATIFALGVGYGRIGETLVQVDLLTANELDRDWYDFRWSARLTPPPPGSRTKGRRVHELPGGETRVFIQHRKWGALVGSFSLFFPLFFHFFSSFFRGVR